MKQKKHNKLTKSALMLLLAFPPCLSYAQNGNGAESGDPWEGLTTKWYTREDSRPAERPYIVSGSRPGADDGLIYQVLSPYSDNLLLIDPVFDFQLADSQRPDRFSLYQEEVYDVPGTVSWNNRDFTVRHIFYAWNYSHLKKLRLPDTLESIIAQICTNCPDLEEVDLGNGLSRLGYNCFVDAPALTKVKLSERLNFIEDSCFVNCGFERIELDNQLMSIGNHCFSDCRNLKEITIPVSVRDMGMHAFNNLPSLEKVVINSTFARSLYNAFCNCPSIREVHISVKNPPALHGSFSGIVRDICYVYVPEGTVEKYRQKWGDVFLPDHILEENASPAEIFLPGADASREETYSLDGLRVDEEGSHGIFIRRKGGKSIKIAR